MPDYSLYFLDEHNHVRHVVKLRDCSDDAEALRSVDKHRELRPMELWQGGRVVRRFGEADGPG